MVCHCQNTQILIDVSSVYIRSFHQQVCDSDRLPQRLIPCIEDPSSPNATCTDAQIGTQIGIVGDLCTFFNATGYADYIGCNGKLTHELESELLYNVCCFVDTAASPGESAMSSSSLTSS